jgi:hypothetical protein
MFNKSSYFLFVYFYNPPGFTYKMHLGSVASLDGCTTLLLWNVSPSDSRHIGTWVTLQVTP